MADDAPRRTGSWLHAFAVVATVLIGVAAFVNALEWRFRGDGALNLIAAVVAFGLLAIVSRPRS